MRKALAQARCQRGTEIDVCNCIVKYQLAYCSGHFYLPVEHDVRAVNDVECLFNVMIAYENADAAMPQPGYDCLNVVHCYRIYTCERLVQHHELRIGNQRPRNLE